MWSQQRVLGYPSYPDDYALKLTLRGIKRLGRSHRPPRHPFSAQELLAMYEQLNTLLPWDMVLWCAITLAFRALLRKSHFTVSVHNLRWKDLSIYPDHLILVLPTSKTDQFSDHPHRVVLNSSIGSPLCPAFWLTELSRVNNPLESDFIFRLPGPSGLQPLTYNWFNTRLKSLASAVGLPDTGISCHSLRHGGTSHMSAFGSGLMDIRARGSWALSAIHNYLHHSVDTLRQKDLLISSTLP